MRIQFGATLTTTDQDFKRPILGRRLFKDDTYRHLTAFQKEVLSNPRIQAAMAETDPSIEVSMSRGSDGIFPMRTEVNALRSPYKPANMAPRVFWANIGNTRMDYQGRDYSENSKRIFIEWLEIALRYCDAMIKVGDGSVEPLPEGVEAPIPPKDGPSCGITY